MNTPLLGSSPAMQSLRNMVQRIAPSSATVLITGESGTGKELVARALHAASGRSEHRFVAINCGAIPRDLLESELFGHRKGAFTGAVADRIGRFEQAHGGTIFLDEIGDLPLEMQVKLLRVLQERVVDVLGASQATPVDVRVIAATHRDLEALVENGDFREDLYYRLNVVPLEVPPLRERSQDVPQLLALHAAQVAASTEKSIHFDEPSLEALCAYAWPGNVRELNNLVDRLTALFPGECISLSTLPQTLLPKELRLTASAPAESAGKGVVLQLVTPKAHAHAAEGSTLPIDGINLKAHLAQVERHLIEQALMRTNGNVTQAAKLLGTQRTTLIEKLGKFSLRAA